MRHAVALVLLLLPVAALAAFRREPVAAAFEPAAPEESPADTLAAPSFLESIGLQTMSATRGERNNNPGNLRPGSKWQGLANVQGDPGYLQFDTAEAGIRAMAKLLRNYQNVYGLATVREIISRWAPASENNTAAYVRAVAAALSVGPDEPLDLSDGAVLRALVVAIIHHENGRNIFTAAQIDTGVNAA